MLRSWRCNIVLSDYEPTENKSDDAKDRFYKEVETVFYQFPNYNMKT